MAARMTAAAAAAVNSAPTADTSLEIVLELEPPRVEAEGNRAERMARQQTAFQAMAAPVRAIVVASGGNVETEAWINCTIKARVPASAIVQLTKADGIVTIDLPHRLERD